MGSLYLGGPTIQEVDDEMMMGLSIYGVAVMDGSLYSRFYGAHNVDQEATGVCGNLHNIIRCFLSHPVIGQLLDVSLLGEPRSLPTLVEKNSMGV